MRLAGFETIAKPHRDIQRGLSTADTYAAKLGQVAKGEGPEEYRKPDQFFQKTYMTEGLKGLLSGIEGRLKGRERQQQDPIVQLQTPFGGGKTHTLIALYHKAREWNARPIVLVGSELETSDTFWGEIEKQLTGHQQRFKGQVAPGSNPLVDMFRQTEEPVLILMDEVLQYLERASGVAVEESTLANQTIAFMLSLTEAVAQCKRVAFVVTFQESEIARIADRFPLFGDLIRRMRRTVTPVGDGEIASIIRSRLFSRADFNEGEAKKVVREFARYARQNNILPQGTQESEYRERFLKSYPFQPEVIDVLYERWGSFPEFQRTRGMLRLLSRVVYRACGKNRPYITLADFDLSENTIREELLEHIDAPYRSVIASDITGENAGAKQVDSGLGDTYKPLALGTRTATAIFLYSFTGGTQRGAALDAIKRSTAVVEHPASIIDAARNQLAEHLFYLRTENGNAYFDAQPNLKRIVRTRIENIDAENVERRLSGHLRKSFRSGSTAHFKTYVLPKEGADIPDDEGLKLIVLDRRDDAFCRGLVDVRGGTPRTNRNTVFFLLPLLGEAKHLKTEIERAIAYEEVQKDKSLNLSDAQKKEIGDTLKRSENALETALRQDYRLVLIPEQEGFSEADMGMPAEGMNTALDQMVYEQLRVKGRILTDIGPRNISLRYLQKNETVFTSQLLNSSLRTPGETLVLREAWIEGIRKGVANGTFAIGEKEGTSLVPWAFRSASAAVEFGNTEVIIHPDLIRESITAADILREYLTDTEAVSTSRPFAYTPQSENTQIPVREVWESAIREGVQNGVFGLGRKTGEELTPIAFRGGSPFLTFSAEEVLLQASLCPHLFVVTSESPEPTEPTEVAPEIETPVVLAPTVKKTINIRFTLPHGKLSNVATQLNGLQGHFENMQIHLIADSGEMSAVAYEEFKEALRGIGCEVEEG